MVTVYIMWLLCVDKQARLENIVQEKTKLGQTIAGHERYHTYAIYLYDLTSVGIYVNVGLWSYNVHTD